MQLLSSLYNTGIDPFRAALGRLRQNDELRPYRELYDILDVYYHHTGLYDALRRMLNQRGAWMQDIKALRNPAFAVVEFYAATVVPGPLETALPIIAPNERIIEPINRIYAWSNWQVRKQTNVRRSARYGDSFAKVTTRANGNGQARSVFFDLIHPRTVTAFDIDERDYLTFVRIDVPQQEQSGREIRRWMYTEVWDKQANRYRTWNHQQDADTPLDELGTPEVDEAITGFFGFDFIPIVRFPHLDIGEERGQSAFVQALDGIDELNRQATRLHQMLFRHNNVTHVLEANQISPLGESLPAPSLSRFGNGSAGDDDDGPGEGTVQLGEDMFYRLPGQSKLSQLVPNINYDAALNVVNAQIQSLESWDLPELVYYRIPDRADASGRAIQLMLTAATAKAREVRGNNEAAQVRANQMALTIGQVNGLPGFASAAIGTFDDGEFEHSFKDRDIIPLNELEEAQAESERMRALEVKRNDLGIPRAQLWREAGYDEEQIKQMLSDALAEQAAYEELMQRRFDRGLEPPDGDV